MRQMVEAKKLWRILEGDTFSAEDVEILSSVLLENLRDPMIPPPILRREPKSYPTPVQDMIANEMFP
jgi:hypothetical protein